MGNAIVESAIIVVYSRLILTFNSDSQAMAQAVNGLVYLRTRPNKRLKIYLPQSGCLDYYPETNCIQSDHYSASVTMRMKGVLEKKLGIVNEEFVKSRQLLIREISDECSDADVRNAFALLDNVDSVEFRHDALEFVVTMLNSVTHPLSDL
jgi:hypothetical protein